MLCPGGGAEREESSPEGGAVLCPGGGAEREESSPGGVAVLCPGGGAEREESGRAEVEESERVEPRLVDTNDSEGSCSSINLCSKIVALYCSMTASNASERLKWEFS